MAPANHRCAPAASHARLSLVDLPPVATYRELKFN
jgi:hypothetical protein